MDLGPHLGLGVLGLVLGGWRSWMRVLRLRMTLIGWIAGIRIGIGRVLIGTWDSWGLWQVDSWGGVGVCGGGWFGFFYRKSWPLGVRGFSQVLVKLPLAEGFGLGILERFEFGFEI